LIALDKSIPIATAGFNDTPNAPPAKPAATITPPMAKPAKSLPDGFFTVAVHNTTKHKVIVKINSAKAVFDQDKPAFTGIDVPNNAVYVKAPNDAPTIYAAI
jgi:hypothetical protein